MKMRDPRNAKTGKINTRIIKEFLKINCPIEKAPTVLNNFFKKYSLNIYVSKDYFPVTKQKNKNLLIKFTSSSGKDLEIYSSLMFSLDVKIKSKYYNFITGGRYDDLTNNLGFKNSARGGNKSKFNMIIWLASYPKRGNTWLRALLSSYFSSNGDFNLKMLENIKSFPTEDNFKNYKDKFNNPGDTSKYWISEQEK